MTPTSGGVAAVPASELDAHQAALAHIRALTVRVAAASETRDWDALAAIDRELAAALPQLAAHAVRLGAERAALAALRHAHRGAQARCRDELSQLDARLGALRSHRQGWMAYALDDLAGVVTA